MIKQLAIVGIGGGVGSILRYLTSVLTSKYYIGAFPLATFGINLLGCMLIGLFIGLSERHQVISSDLRLLLITGFCGGYTTFSTFSAENLHLFQNGNYVTLISYTLLSVLLGLVAVYIGVQVSRIF